jgi:Trypsin-like peptidase domain/AAA ATPase domain
MMARTVETALVRIFDEVGQVHGTGFLVDDCHVLTCAHVIEAAVGADHHSLDSGNIASVITKHPVSLDFPFVSPGAPYSAGNRCPVHIACWKPVPPEITTPTPFQQDIALLRLDPGPPPGAQPLRLSGAIAGMLFAGKQCEVYGVPQGAQDGEYAKGVIGREVGGELWQINRLAVTEYPIIQGFSGAPVWVSSLHHAVGMVVAADNPKVVDTHNARFLPTSYLIRALPHLPQYPYVENPYRGLLVFDEEHQEFFFGREEETCELATRVETEPLVVVTGPSGSGKSSLVRAGLLPCLESSQCWYVVPPFRPGTDPLFAFALALVDPSVAGEERVTRARKLAEGLGENVARWPLILTTLLQHRLQGRRVLIVIDQFEELLRNDQSTETQQLVLDGLFALINRDSNPDLPVTVLLTMRSDFLLAVRSYPPCQEMLDHGDALFKLLDMGAADLRKAIAKPAEPLGVGIESTVIDAMVDAMKGEPGNLPFLGSQPGRCDHGRGVRGDREGAGCPEPSCRAGLWNAEPHRARASKAHLHPVSSAGRRRTGYASSGHRG